MPRAYTASKAGSKLLESLTEPSGIARPALFTCKLFKLGEMAYMYKKVYLKT